VEKQFLIFIFSSSATFSIDEKVGKKSRPKSCANATHMFTADPGVFQYGSVTISEALGISLRPGAQ